MKKAKNFTKILFKGTVAVSIANAGSQLVGLILLPVFTKYLSPEEFGVISLVSLIVTFLALVYNPGMMSATMRLYHSTEDENDRRELIGSAHRFFLFIPIVPVIIGLIWGEYIFSIVFNDFKFYPYGFLSLLLAFFIQPSRMWTTLMTLLYKIEKTAFLTALSIVLGLISATVLIVVFEMGAMGRVLAMFVPAFFLYIISLIEIKKYSQNIWSYHSIKKQLLFGFPLIIALWAYQGLNFIGKYMLEILSTLENVGLYSIGYTLSILPMFLVIGFKQLWSSVFYENMNNKTFDLIIKLIKNFNALITLLCLLFVLFSKELIILFIDESFHSVIPIVGLLVLASFFNGLLTISNSFLSYNNKFSKISLFAAIATIINIILNLFLIPSSGILGASISLAISYFIFYMLSVISERKQLKNFQSKKTALVPILAMLVGVISNFLLDKFLFENYLSILELFLKLLYFLVIIYVFFKIKLIQKSDFLYIINLLKKKIIK